MIELVNVIKPLLVPWLGLGGDGFFSYFSLGVTDGFLEGWSSFPSAFLFGAPFLCAAFALTNTLCLAASISAKDMMTLGKQTRIKRTNNNKCNLRR